MNQLNFGDYGFALALKNANPVPMSASSVNISKAAGISNTIFYVAIGVVGFIGLVKILSDYQEKQEQKKDAIPGF